MLAREKKALLDGLHPLLSRVELRLVIREIPWETDLGKHTAILQYRTCSPYMDDKTVCYDCTEWQDVPVEDEDG